MCRFDSALPHPPRGLPQGSDDPGLGHGDDRRRRSGGHPEPGRGPSRCCQGRHRGPPGGVQPAGARPLCPGTSGLPAWPNSRREPGWVWPPTIQKLPTHWNARSQTPARYTSSFWAPAPLSGRCGSPERRLLGKDVVEWDDAGHACKREAVLRGWPGSAGA